MMTKDKKKTFIGFDQLVGILTIPIALFLIVMEYNTPKPNIPQKLGPEAMPIGVLSLIIIVAVFIFINAVHEKRKTESRKDAAAIPPEPVEYGKYRTLVLVILGMVLYGILLNPLGFILSTTLLVIWEARLFERGKWVRNVTVSVLFSASVYYCFVNLLDVLLPQGILGW